MNHASTYLLRTRAADGLAASLMLARLAKHTGGEFGNLPA